MNTNRLWCAICKRTVEVVIEEGGKALLAPLVGGTFLGALGKQHGGWAGAIGGALVGVVGGAVLHSAVTTAQRAVCGECRTPLA